MIEKLLRYLSPSRAIFYTTILLLLPFVLLCAHFVTKMATMDHMSSQVEEAITLYLQKEEKQAFNKACYKHYAKRDKSALEKALGDLSLMKKEKEDIEKVMGKASYFGNGSLEERLAFLKGKDNCLIFSEGAVSTKYGIQETIETLIHPVEIDNSDLKEILTLIEENHPLFVQTLIVDFQIKRSLKDWDNEVFICNMKLLKREFL